MGGGGGVRVAHLPCTMGDGTLTAWGRMTLRILGSIPSAASCFSARLYEREAVMRAPGAGGGGWRRVGKGEDVKDLMTGCCRRWRPLRRSADRSRARLPHLTPARQRPAESHAPG